MPLFRPDSFLDRLGKAGRFLTGKEERDYGYLPPSMLSVFQGPTGIPPTFKAEASQKAYSDNPWLYSAVNVISHEVARTKFHLVQKKRDGTVEPVDSHQSVETLACPQPVGEGRTMLTRNQLFFLLTQYLMLNGEGFWLMDKPIKVSGSPQVLTPLNPAYMYEELNRDGTIKRYIYRLPDYTTGGVPLEPQDVVHFKFTDPKNWYRGHSPVQPIRYAVDTYKEADVLNFNRLKHNAVPGGALETDKNPSDAERHKLLEQFRSAYAGAENAGKTVILPNGFKFNPTQQSNQEMQFIEGKNLTRDEILANYRVGMEMFGKTESQTRANADASLYVFTRFTVLPILELIADTLTNDYLTAFPRKEGMEFIFDDPVPENEENKRATAEKLFGSGALTPNEMRQQFGLEELDIEGMDVPYLPMSSLPMGEPPPSLTETNTNPIPDEEDDNEGQLTELPRSIEEIFDEAKETQLLSKTLYPFVATGFQKGVEQGKKQTGRAVEDEFDAQVIRRLKKKSLFHAALAVGTTKEALEKLLLKAVTDGQSIQQLAKAINDYFDLESKRRAVVIARTEMTDTINDGTLHAIQREGYSNKEWSTVIDGRERESHANADGQVVGINESFIIGGSPARYPGDDSLPPGERIQCRCAVLAAGLSDDRKRAFGKLFLRTHGMLERRLMVSLVQEFGREKRRVLSHFPS